MSKSSAKSTKLGRTLRLTQLSVLVALLLIFGFTSIGYIKIGVIEITLNVIPVAIAAIVLGPSAGAICGAVFGLTSFWQCFGMSAFGTTLFGVNPVFTFIICVIPRVLEGWLTGIIFKVISKKTHPSQIDLVKWDSTIPINKRKIGVSILFSLLTFGIYAIYWKYLLIKNIKAMKKEETNCVGEILCLLFVPFYSLYWWFTRGEYIKKEFNKQGYSSHCNGFIYLILGIFCCDIVSMAIMQSNFNSLPTEETQLKEKNNSVPCAVASVCCPLLNTLLFVGSFILLFGKTDVFASLYGQSAATNIVSFFAWFVGLNGVVEVIAGFVIASAVSKALLTANKKLLKNITR